MSSQPLVLVVPHGLGRDEAMRRLKDGLSKAAINAPFIAIEDQRWSGERMDFKARALGQVAIGNIQVGEDSVRFEVTLPWLLQRFAERVRRALGDRVRGILIKKT